MTSVNAAVVHTVLDAGGGGEGLLRRRVEVPAAGRFEGAAGPGGELWFVIDGTARLESPARPAALVRYDTGVWLPPGARYRLHAEGPGTLTLDSVLLPAAAPHQPEPAELQLAALRDCAVEVTGDREFRVLLGPGHGCSAATQFVGEIPPGRAPEHTHTYDEVVLVLAGEGVLHAGAADHPLAAGSCVHLRPGQPHCLENTGRGTLRVLGVFHPGGSPASKQERPPPA